LLNHAVSTSPFYKSYKNNKTLTNFSVINKLIVKNNLSEIKSRIYIKKKKIKISTSGSTGTPMILFQDLNKRYRNIADTIYFAKRAGFKLGTKLIYMRVWTPKNKKGFFTAWMQNVKMLEVLNLDNEEISKLLQILQVKEEKGIISYASSLEAVCRYLDEIDSDPLDCNINSIISNSELLNEYTKSSVKKYFKSSIVSRYSNNENGILSQQIPGEGNEFEINWASFVIEILKFDEDKPVEPGELGRVVITDLFNYCMPLIRYDTGDIACVENNDKDIPVFKRVEGRKYDLVHNTMGNMVSGYAIAFIMYKYTNLNQYQFIQESKTNYILKLNPTQEFNEETQILSELKECLGNDSNIKIEYIQEIPVLSSGKRRVIINNFVKDKENVVEF